MKILALDPGGTTGWATCTTSLQEKLGPGQIEQYGAIWACGQLGPAEHHEALWDLLQLQETEQNYIVVCESFEYRNQSRPGLVLSSVEYIGVTKLFMETTNNDQLFFQTAHMGGMDKGNPVTSKVLKKLDLYHPGWHHANDAMAHLVNFILSTRNAPYQNIMSVLRPE